MTERFFGVVGVAEALGVTRHAVHKWRSRYPAGSSHPFPEPDVEVDGAPGWKEDRLAEIVRWREGLPGRGAGGGRPPANRQERLLEEEYLREAAARGLDTDEAMRTLDAFAEVFPEMTEADIRAWLVREWRS